MSYPTETIRSIFYDTLTDGLPQRSDRLFHTNHIGDRSLTNMPQSGTLGDRVYHVQRLLAGGPAATLPTWQDVLATLEIGARNMWQVPLNMKPDEVEKTPDGELEPTPMGLHYLAWNFGPLTVAPRQLFCVRLEAFGEIRPKGYLRVALDGLLVQSVY